MKKSPPPYLSLEEFRANAVLIHQHSFAGRHWFDLDLDVRSQTLYGQGFEYLRAAPLAPLPIAPQPWEYTHPHLFLLDILHLMLHMLAPTGTPTDPIPFVKKDIETSQLAFISFESLMEAASHVVRLCQLLNHRRLSFFEAPKYGKCDYDDKCIRNLLQLIFIDFDAYSKHDAWYPHDFESTVTKLDKIGQYFVELHSYWYNLYKPKRQIFHFNKFPKDTFTDKWSHTATVLGKLEPGSYKPFNFLRNLYDDASWYFFNLSRQFHVNQISSFPGSEFYCPLATLHLNEDWTLTPSYQAELLYSTAPVKIVKYFGSVAPAEDPMNPVPPPPPPVEQTSPHLDFSDVPIREDVMTLLEHMYKDE